MAATKTESSAAQSCASIASAISNNFKTLFQFLPVPATPRILSILDQGNFVFPIPFGK
jgi:hypothetical protein